MDVKSAFEMYRNGDNRSTKKTKKLRHRKVKKNKINLNLVVNANDSDLTKSNEDLKSLIINKNKHVKKSVKTNGITKVNKKKKKSENNTRVPEIKINQRICEEMQQKISSDDSVNSEESAQYIPSRLSSVEQGREMFSWMIYPITIKDFCNHGWEKKPLLVQRDEPNYYKKIISTPVIDQVLRKEFIMFSKNIDITSYDNGVRETHNPVGRALPPIVWDYYLNGCSVRFLNPQTYIREVQLLNATLQDYFNCFVGSNVYLTPPNSQGFAPHYDDIEAFVLQIEGKKRWKVYAPLSKEEELPRFSSRNFDQSEIGKPIIEVELKAGDMLYFPRGFIHQAVTVDGEHSLHITISTYQKHSWGDVFDKMIPKALEIAFLKDVEFRKGVPFDLFEHLGLAHLDSEAPRRNEIVEHVKKLFSKLSEHLPFDYATDQLGKKFIHEALPPVLEENEKDLTVFGDCSKITEAGVVDNRVEIEPDTRVKLLRANILRLVEEESEFKIYYTIENSKEYHGNELQYFEIVESQAAGVATLIKAYPDFVAVKDIDIEDETGQIELIVTLWEKGLLITEEPLAYIE